MSQLFLAPAASAATFRPDKKTVLATVEALARLGWVGGGEATLHWTDAGEIYQRRFFPRDQLEAQLPKDVPWACRLELPGPAASPDGPPPRCESVALLLAPTLTLFPGHPVACACGASLAQPFARRRDPVALGDAFRSTLAAVCPSCGAAAPQDAPAFRFALALRFPGDDSVELDPALAAGLRDVLAIELRALALAATRP